MLAGEQAVGGVVGGALHPLDRGACLVGRGEQPRSARLGFAERAAQFVGDGERQRRDAVAQGGGAVGEREQRLVLRAGVGAELVEVGAQPPDMPRQPPGAFVALLGEPREAVVERHEAIVEVGDEPLRRALLLGDPRGQRVERRSAPSSR